MIRNNSKILIVRLSALGDCVHTLPVLSGIKEKYPDVFIGWICEDTIAPLLENNPFIDKLHIFPKKYFKSKNIFQKITYLKEFSKELKKQNYDIVIDSQELFKSAILGYLSGAELRLAHKNSREFSDLFATKKLPEKKIFDITRHVIERNLDFLRFLGIENADVKFPLNEISENSLKQANEIFSKLNNNKKNVIISPTTTWTTKFWDKDKWLKLIKLLKDYNVIITGTNKDKTYIEDILNGNSFEHVLDISGQTTFDILRAIFNKADLLICLDSGTAHLASVNPNLKIIALFGATSEVRNGAFGNENINIRKHLCVPCYKKHCNKYNSNYCKCIMEIYPEEIFNVVKKIFGV